MGLPPPDPDAASSFIATLLGSPPEGRDVIHATAAGLITRAEARDLVIAHSATWLSRPNGIDEPSYDRWRSAELERSFERALLGAAVREPAERALAAMERAWSDGCPVARPSGAVAAVAARRWESSSRRGVKQQNRAARIEDLVKGLIAHLEPDRGMVGRLKTDYEYLATAIADALEPSVPPDRR